MENMRPHDTAPQQPSIETLSDADAWTRIESIDPVELATKLADLLTDENIQRAKQSELNRYTSDIRTSSTIDDLEKINQEIAMAQERENTILHEVASGNGLYATLKMQIANAKARGRDAADLEQQMSELIKTIAPLEESYGTNSAELDRLLGSKALLEKLAVVQGPYIATEKTTWEISTEYKAALGQLALALDRIHKLPSHIPIPMAPPDMSTQNPADPLPLSLDCHPEDKRQLFTLDIQDRIQKVQEIEEKNSPEEESEPVVLSYQELRQKLHKTKILVSTKTRNRLNELMQEDTTV